MEQRITSQHYDMHQGEIGRIWKMYCLQRVLPMGNMGGFTRVREIAVLFLVHRCGKRLFRLLISHEARLTKVYRWLRRK